MGKKKGCALMNFIVIFLKKADNGTGVSACMRTRKGQ
jgi:hypothetical protein